MPNCDADLTEEGIATLYARMKRWRLSALTAVLIRFLAATADALRGAEAVVRALLVTPEAPADEERVLLPSTTVREGVLRAGTFHAVTETVLVHRSDLALYALHLDPGCDKRSSLAPFAVTSLA